MTVIHGDATQVLKTLEPESIDFVFTSPSPFGFGGGIGQGIGSEKEKGLYIFNIAYLFEQVKRVLKPSGCIWLQLADSHDENGSMRCVPEAVSNYLRTAHGWLLRSKCYWVRTEKFGYQEDYNRFARDVEHLFFFTKNKDHYFNNPHKKVQSSVFYADYKEPRKNEFESGFPEKIIERCISLSCPPKGVVLDPLADSGTVGVVAKKMGRDYIMIDISYEKVLAMRGRLGE